MLGLRRQENYREQYLKYQDRFFLDIAVFYFVVDVQDVPNFPAAVEYLKKIVDFFAERSIDLPIVILLNKVDPDLVDTPRIKKNIVKLKEMILMSLGKFPGDFYTTSAFDIDSVMKALSQSLSRNLSRTEIIADVLKELVDEYSLVGIMLMDSNGITFADHYQDHLPPTKMDALRTIRVLALKKIMEQGVGNLRFQDDNNPAISVFGEISSFAADKSTFYLLILSEDEATIAEKMVTITPRAEQILWEILQQ